MACQRNWWDERLKAPEKLAVSGSLSLRKSSARLSGGQRGEGRLVGVRCELDTYESDFASPFSLVTFFLCVDSFSRRNLALNVLILDPGVGRCKTPPTPSE